ncbi:MAG: radical SAM protein [Lachnospiraceae bacterium]|nr:radical SAM protein [Lachnospiraceae bacterium]
MKKYIIYGIIMYFRLQLDKKRELSEYISAFMDSEPENWGKSYLGIEVLPTDKVQELEFEKIVITSSAYYNEIKNNLMEKYSISEEKIQYIDEFLADRTMNADILPKAVAIDACTSCQLNCKACYMRLNNFGGVGNGYLKYDDFKCFIDSNPQIKIIELSNNGEIFLNPELKKIIEYAYINGVQLTAWNGVNLNDVSDDMLETLVLCEFRGLTVSLDGTKQETYAYYRRNGDYNRVIRNIRKINYYKHLYRKQWPELRWQFVVMNHNELEAAEAKFLAYELDMKICFKQTWEPGFVPQHPEMLLWETGIDFRRNESPEQHHDTEVFGNHLCRQIYLEPRINWDGRLFGCCTNYQYDFGINVFEVGLREALRDSRYMAAKKMLMNKSAECDNIADIPCSKCEYYDAIRKCGNYICTRDIVI